MTHLDIFVAASIVVAVDLVVYDLLHSRYVVVTAWSHLLVLQFLSLLWHWGPR